MQQDPPFQVEYKNCQNCDDSDFEKDFGLDSTHSVSLAEDKSMPNCMPQMDLELDT